MKKLHVLLAVTAISLVACANRPESIRASHVSHEKFVHLDCTALTTKMSATRTDLEKFSKMQDTKANGDAVGVFLLGIPFSKLSGDHEGDVARLKGEVEAIETAQVKGKCSGEQKSS
ncbi:hypothetical protein LP414_31705 [Polaromonas sp. P1(28)-13]|nr:hypothetical protein LP417_30695 [Polaromonas sp. P1-6]UUZ68289.1 hypothetical protein LP416_29450 [Polaromonas sp. P2-4]UUZ75978.1 hypothetical protein LP414_31705 [Polaromonas sp. P1(28)-13]